MTDEWKKTLVAPTDSIRDMLVVIGKSRQQIALVVDGEDRLLGTITDGDVRRSILRSISPDGPVTEIMNPDPTTTSPETDSAARLAIMRERSILHLPVVNDAGKLSGLARLENLMQPEGAVRPNRALLMAGGLGTRLRPLTDAVPKPLLPVGSRPILETIVIQMKEQGIRHFYFAVNHKAEAIKQHFGDGDRLGIEIIYLEESERLGTAGALGLIEDKLDAPLIVMNGDLLTKVDFGGLLSYHAEQSARATICVRELDMQVPYGVLEMEESIILAVTEKPVQRLRVNAGIYVLEPDIVARVSGNEYLDMPDLLHDAIADGGPVVGFPIHEYWMDIGRIEDFDQAVTDFDKLFS